MKIHIERKYHDGTFRTFCGLKGDNIVKSFEPFSSTCNNCQLQYLTYIMKLKKNDENCTLKSLIKKKLKKWLNL